jgi:sec-independent protein translocase protein TatB
MFDLGFQELIVIFIVALLVFGPKKLPELAKNLGKGVGQLRKAMFDLKSEVEREVEETEDKLKQDLPSWKDVSPYDPYQKTAGEDTTGGEDRTSAEEPSVNVPPEEGPAGGASEEEGKPGEKQSGEEPAEEPVEEPAEEPGTSPSDDRHTSGA